MSSKGLVAIIGLGNPGPRFTTTRHNAGFLFIDYLADYYQVRLKSGPQCEWGELYLEIPDAASRKILLVKPTTFMNNSGDIWPWLSKQGVTSQQMLVAHDELEKKFGSVATRLGGSARGHNGLRSFIGRCGEEFWRLRIGIDRPVEKNQVGNYVLQPFTAQELARLPEVFEEARGLLGRGLI